jgi:hypothetical protein
MRFGTRNMRSLYRAESLVIVPRGLSKYNLDLVRVQVVRWEGGGTEPVGKYTFFYREGSENYELGTGFMCTRESYQQLRGLSLLVIGTASTRNSNLCSTNSLNTKLKKFVERFKWNSIQGRYF